MFERLSLLVWGFFVVWLVGFGELYVWLGGFGWLVCLCLVCCLLFFVCLFDFCSQ